MIKLNIACGPNIFPHDGWINYDHADLDEYFQFVRRTPPVDAMPAAQRKLCAYAQKGGVIRYVRHDICKPFPVAGESVDFIYVGQTIEHLSPIHQAPAFLAECFRMLRVGGVLRMTTPDLDVLLLAYNLGVMKRFESDQPTFYRDAVPGMQLALLMFGSGGANCTQTTYEGHQCLYTRESVDVLLHKSGFSEVEFFSEHCGKNPNIAKEVQDEGLSHSMIVEAVRSSLGFRT